MKNKIRGALFSAFGFVLIFLTLSYCSSDQEAKPNSFNVEKIKVEQKTLSDFIIKYEAFKNGLSQSKQDLLIAYINKQEADAENAKVNVTPECHCPEGSATCSASGTFSECCTCWDPNTQSGSCGTVLGFAKCKVTDNNPPAKTQQAKPELVKVYPKNFYDMLDYLETNDIDVKSIRNDFASVVKAAQ